MANTTIELRQSSSTGQTPSLGVLANGELAINRADGILYYKSSSNTLGSIRTTQPAGLTTEVQFNDAGSFGTDSNFTYNKTNDILTVVGGVIAAGINVAPALAANAVYSAAAFNQANSVYLPSVTRLNVTNSGSSAYLIDQYLGSNPTIYINAGETIAFNLAVTGHPFMIRVSSGSTNYSNGLTHIATDGTATTNSSAQGQVTGTLYWKVPFELASNNYVYQCSIHSGMVGTIRIGEPSAVVLTQTNAAFSKANSANILAQAAFDAANSSSSAAGAFDKANTANITAEAAFSKANSANVLAQSSFNKANTANVTGEAAFAKANTSNVTGEAAFAKANTANVTAEAAFVKANTANVTGEAAFAKANVATTIADSGYAFANTVNIKTDAAFAFANSVNIKTDAAFAFANSVNIKTDAAFSKANAANILAQAAFDKANTGSGGGGGTTDFGFGVIYTPNNAIYANATSANDKLIIVGESSVVVFANSSTKTITVAGTPGAQGLTVDYGFVADTLFYSIDYGTLS